MRTGWKGPAAFISADTNLIANAARLNPWLLPLLAGEGGDGGSVQIAAFCLAPTLPLPRAFGRKGGSPKPCFISADADFQ